MLFEYLVCAPCLKSSVKKSLFDTFHTIFSAYFDQIALFLPHGNKNPYGHNRKTKNKDPTSTFRFRILVL